jgi:hypothetical protein
MHLDWEISQYRTWENAQVDDSIIYYVFYFFAVFAICIKREYIMRNSFPSIHLSISLYAYFMSRNRLTNLGHISYCETLLKIHDRIQFQNISIYRPNILQVQI